MLLFRIIPIVILMSALATADDYIMFPHQLHIDDMELTCDECHDGITEAKDLSTRQLPEKDYCISCHDGDSATEDCESCHNDPDEPLPFAESQPIQNVDFSHYFHLSKNLDCSVCHGEISEGDGSELAKIWNESGCRSCHQTSLPESHSLEWATSHGEDIDQQAGNSCSSCHYQETCDACHLVQEVEPRVHPAGFIILHGLEATGGTTDCSSCHDLVSDCRSCHQQNNTIPIAHHLPDWVTRVGTDGGLHGDQALDDADNCLICHEPASDPTCARCHGN